MHLKQRPTRYYHEIRRLNIKKKDIKEDMMKRFGWNGYQGNASNKQLVSRAYKVATTEMSNKLFNLNKSKNILAKKQEIVNNIGRKVEEFFNVQIVESLSNPFDPTAKQRLARAMFCKMVIELDKKGITGRHALNYLNGQTNRITISRASVWRTKLNKSFADGKVKRLYDECCKYVNL